MDKSIELGGIYPVHYHPALTQEHPLFKVLSSSQGMYCCVPCDANGDTCAGRSVLVDPRMFDVEAQRAMAAGPRVSAGQSGTAFDEEAMADLYGYGDRD